MNYEEEISYRAEIMARIRRGEKISSEERLWLVTHRIINRTLSYPFLNTDIIHICPKVNYCIRIRIESLAYHGRMIPVITVPGGRGKIVANTPLIKHNGDISQEKAVKILGLLLDLDHNETEIVYHSDLGLLGISYECDYFDDKQRIMIRKNSCIGDPNFAMTCDVLADSKVRYCCKAPNSDCFDSLVFSVEWEVQS